MADACIGLVGNPLPDCLWDDGNIGTIHGNNAMNSTAITTHIIFFLFMDDAPDILPRMSITPMNTATTVRSMPIMTSVIPSEMRHSTNSSQAKAWQSTYFNFFISCHKADYVQCPFCDRLFRGPHAKRASGERPLEERVMSAHHKVRVRKRSNYRWMDESEVKKRLM